MNQNDDPKIRELLKKSPTLTPPESFYRGVLERVERKTEKQESRTPWYWGYPARALASACVLMVVVLVTRQTKEKEPERLQEARQESFQAESKPAPATVSAKPLAAKQESKADAAPASSASQEVMLQARKFSPAAPAASQPVRADKSFWAEEQSNISRRAVVSDDQEQAKVEESPEKAKQSTLENSLKKVVSVVTAVPRKIVPSRGANAGVELTSTSSSEQREWRGKASGIERFREVVVRDETAWRQLWNEHSRTILPSPAVPPVDFSQDMVIGIFAGAKPSGGHSIGIATTRAEPHRWAVIYYEMEPEPDAVYPTGMAQPYVMQVVPRTDLPVVFLKAK